MEIRPKRWDIWRHALGVGACIALGWASLAAGLRIPLLADATYGFHELGHLFTWFLPDVYRAMMGSLVQMLIPLGLAGYFLLFQRDLLGVSLMLAWTSTSAHDTSTYVADAGKQALELLPAGATHDWGFALTELGKLSAAPELAWFLQAAALAFIFIAIGVAAVGAVLAFSEYEQRKEVDVYLQGPPELERYGYEEWARGVPQAPAGEQRP